VPPIFDLYFLAVPLAFSLLSLALTLGEAEPLSPEFVFEEQADSGATPKQTISIMTAVLRHLSIFYPAFSVY